MTSAARSPVLIIDDDPTGTQAASGVRILLKPVTADLDAFFASRDRAIFLLTNSRAMPESAAVRLLKDLVESIRTSAANHGVAYRLVLRGDSTLRGHVFAEIDAVDDLDSVIVFAPAFPEAGRTTIAGIHYVTVDGQRMPVAQTEFARDPVFGYETSDLRAFTQARSGGRPVVLIPLTQIREGARAVARAIQEAPTGAVVIPDAVRTNDLEILERGIRLTEGRGRRVLVRSASTLAAMRADLVGHVVTSADIPDIRRLLVVCGSHTTASTTQLQALVEARRLEVTEVALHLGAAATAGLVRDVAQRLRANGIAVVASPRLRSSEHASLVDGARMADALGSVVHGVAGELDAVIAKGGITSADSARRLGAESAFVVGQLEPGVPLWRLEIEPPIPYAVVPGNVGDSGLLARLVDRFVDGRTAGRRG